VGGQRSRALSPDYRTWTTADWRRFVREDLRRNCTPVGCPPAVGRAFARRFFRSPTIQTLCQGAPPERLQALIVLAALYDVEFQPVTHAVERQLLAAGALPMGDRKARAKQAHLLARALALVKRTGINPRARLVRELEQSVYAVQTARRTRPPGPRSRPRDTRLIYHLDYGLAALGLGTTARFTLICRVVQDWYRVTRSPKGIRHLVAERERVDLRQPPLVGAADQREQPHVFLTCTARRLIALGLTTPLAAAAHRIARAAVLVPRIDPGSKPVPEVDPGS
jgi:hypothetical protein